MSTSNAVTPLQRRFPLWDSELEAARSWVEHGERTPSKARFASSMVLLRDSPRGTQTLLSYRRGYSPLGTVSFPGGSVETTDNAEVDWIGPSPAEWAKTLGLPDSTVAHGHIVAVIRELFEETGILLAGTDKGSLADLTGGADLMAKREAIAEQDFAFSDLLAKRGLALRTDLLKPIMNWVSPDFAHRRFNTWYFAAAAPVNQTVTPLRSKGTWLDWVSPRELLEQADTSALGDAIGAENTVGQPLAKLISSGGDLILHKIAKANCCIAFLNYKRPHLAFQPQLRHEGDDLWLQIDAPTSQDGVRRER